MTYVAPTWDAATNRNVTVEEMNALAQAAAAAAGDSDAGVTALLENTDSTTYAAVQSIAAASGGASDATVAPILEDTASDSYTAVTTAVDAHLGGDATGLVTTVAGKVSKDTLVLNAADHGIIGDGTTDDGAALQTFLNTAATFGLRAQLAPKTTIRCTTVVTPPSGTRLDLNGSTIKNALPSTSGRVLTVTGVSNVLIENGTVDGDRDNYPTDTAQRHNIHVIGSSQVTIRNVLSINAKGDGIYIGDDNAGCTDIHLDRVTCDGNRRQGLSISAVDGFNAIGCRFINTDGASPQSGVDIEPNADATTVKGIRFVACEFTGNTGYGMSSSLRATPTSTQNSGDFVACSFDGNTAGGVYLNNAAHATITGGTINNNAAYGVLGSSATTGTAIDVKLIGVDIIGNASNGVRYTQAFNRLNITSCIITDNTGIGADISPSKPSSGFQWINNSAGNSGAGTSQTHGMRTGVNVSHAVMIGNDYFNNATAPYSLADDTTTRFLLDAAARLTVTGSRSDGTALASLLTGLAQRGIITDSSSV